MRATPRLALLVAAGLMAPAACQDDLCLHEDEIFMCAAQQDCATGYSCDLEFCQCREADSVPADRMQPWPGVDCATRRQALLEEAGALEGRLPCKRKTDP